MQHRFDALPPSLPAYARLLTGRRRYDGTALPEISASVASAAMPAARLSAYRGLVHAPDDGHLPVFVPQLLAAPLHLRLLADPAFPFPALGLVHLTNRIVLHTAIDARAKLGLNAWVADIREHRLGHAISLKTEATMDGAVVWSADTVALSRSGTPRTERTSKPPRPAPDLADAIEVEVPESMGRAYAKVAGDLNPIHQRAWMARLFGMRRAIVHGTWTAARAISSFWPEDATEPGERTVRFRAPVFLPSRVRMGRDGDALVVVDAESGKEQVRVERALG